jgi:hypothetical protein
MGCAGDDAMVTEIVEFPIPTLLNKAFFKKMSMLIEFTPHCFDWDWASFRTNIVTGCYGLK